MIVVSLWFLILYMEDVGSWGSGIWFIGLFWDLHESNQSTFAILLVLIIILVVVDVLLLLMFISPDLMRRQFFRFLSAATFLINVDIKGSLCSSSASVRHFSDIHKFIVLYLTSLDSYSFPTSFFLPASQLEGFSWLFMRFLPLLLILIMLVDLVDLLQYDFFLLYIFLSLFPLLIPDQFVNTFDLLFIFFDLWKHRGELFCLFLERLLLFFVLLV